tara:strand:- start:5449 stop:6381 length:933 start_codon:yes stop_codon:yes gene_type:complete
MTLIEEFQALNIRDGSIVAIGVFDGLHIGHLTLLKRLGEESIRLHLEPVVMTFRNHPNSVLRRNFVTRYLISVEERIDRIKRLGLENIVTVDFDAELSKLKVESFVNLLIKTIKMKVLVVGPDFVVGHNREGTISVLKNLGRKLGFSVMMIPQIFDSNEKIVSSTAIREAISCGTMERASLMLGYNYSIHGKIVRGAGIGKELGFPTANIEVSDQILVPRDGIYATFATLDNSKGKYMSVTSIGNRPTFDDNLHSVETFILGLQSDIYGSILKLEFVSWLRDQVKYVNIEDLKDQIDKDVQIAKKILENT